MISTIFSACGYLYVRPMAWQKKYRWVETWPGERHEDWTAFDGEIQIGRIMRDLATHNHRGLFLWSGGLSGVRGIRHRVFPHMGWEAEHWMAAKAVEDWYDTMRERNSIEPRDNGRPA